MIEINLLPDEAKARTKRAGSLDIDPRYFIYLIPSLVVILISVHIILAVVAGIKGFEFNRLDARWKGFQSQRKDLDILNKDYYAFMSNAKVMQELNSRRLNWSGKLNRLSLNLPGGVWFNEVMVSEKGFSLKASVVSLQHEEMSLINKFMNNLKSDARFMAGLDNLELGSVQKRSLGGYDVVDFILASKLKAK